jgi:hypothetical protein
VSNIQIFLHENFHNFLRFLGIFPRFIFTPDYLENSWKKKTIFSFLDRIPRAGPIHRTKTACVAPPSARHCQWAPAPSRPHRSATLPLRGPRLSGFSPPNPLHECTGARQQSTTVAPHRVTLVPSAAAPEPASPVHAIAAALSPRAPSHRLAQAAPAAAPLNCRGQAARRQATPCR